MDLAFQHFSRVQLLVSVKVVLESLEFELGRSYRAHAKGAFTEQRGSRGPQNHDLTFFAVLPICAGLPHARALQEAFASLLTFSNSAPVKVSAPKA